MEIARIARMLSASIVAVVTAVFPGGSALRTPRLPIDPAAFTDNSLVGGIPPLEYDPEVFSSACAPEDESCNFAPPQAAPAMAGNAPETAASSPDAASSAPDTTGNAPDAASNAPDTTGNALDTVSNAPDTTGNAPDKLGNAPDIAANAPDTTGNALDTASNATDTAGNAFNTAGNAPLPAPGPQMLALSPIVNGEAQDRIFAVERSESGAFSATAADLHAARIKVPPGTSDDAYVAIASLPGVVAHYDEPNQMLALDVPDAQRDPLTLTVTPPRDKTDLSKLRTAPSVQLNYRLLASKTIAGVGNDALDGDLVLVASRGFAQFVSSANFGTQRGVVRGESFARLEDPNHVRVYTLGDIVTGAVGFSGAVRLSGIQVQSNFQQRPDIFRGPLPQFAGTAALPSAVDLYVDSVKVFTSKVPQGPFVLQSLPQITGRTLSVVTTDPNGHETRISQPFFYAPGLLRRGLSEYSFELGFPRLGGTSTFGNYLGFLAGSGTLRYGLTDRLTVEGHVEAGDGLVNGGIGIAAALGYLGALNGSISLSNFGGAQGGHVTADYQLGLGGISGFASIVREFGRYNTLGSATAVRGFAVPGSGFPSLPPRQKQSIDRVGVFFQLPFDPTTLDISYNRIALAGSNTRTVSTGFTRRINERLSVNGNATVDLVNRNNVALRINFNLRLGNFATASISGNHDRSVNNYSVSLNGFNAGRQNRLGYTLSQRGDDNGNASRSGRLEYRASEAQLSGTIDQSKGDVRAQLSAEGAILVADGRVFPANRIGESFALIKNAGPGAEILQNGRRIARSNQHGNALLPELEAFDETRISLDPTKLPTDYEAQNGTEFNIVTARRGGAVIDFGVRKVYAGLVVIVDAGGKPFPPGTQVMRVGMEPDILGYDGEVFLRDLKPENRIMIDRGGEAGICTGTFAYSEKDIDQPRIGPVKCQ